MMRDDDGQEIHAGDVVSFCYGIPPVGVQAKVADINGVLFAMTPGHKPDKCKLSELRRHVGGFYKIRRRTKMPNEAVTPAEVGGLVDAQTEARALADDLGRRASMEQIVLHYHARQADKLATALAALNS